MELSARTQGSKLGMSQVNQGIWSPYFKLFSSFSLSHLSIHSCRYSFSSPPDTLPYLFPPACSCLFSSCSHISHFKIFHLLLTSCKLNISLGSLSLARGFCLAFFICLLSKAFLRSLPFTCSQLSPLCPQFFRHQFPLFTDQKPVPVPLQVYHQHKLLLIILFKDLLTFKPLSYFSTGGHLFYSSASPHS